MAVAQKGRGGGRGRQGVSLICAPQNDPHDACPKSGPVLSHQLSSDCRVTSAAYPQPLSQPPLPRTLRHMGQASCI